MYVCLDFSIFKGKRILLSEIFSGYSPTTKSLGFFVGLPYPYGWERSVVLGAVSAGDTACAPTLTLVPKPETLASRLLHHL